MDLSNLSERDRRTVEHNQRRAADIKIVKGLMDKGYSVPHIHFLQRRGRLERKS